MLVRYDITLPHDSEELTELYDFIKLFKVEAWGEGISLTKLNRWLGYIQGRVIALGLTTVQAERDFTRDFFKPLDIKKEEYDRRNNWTDC